MNQDLKNKTISGVFWSVINQFGEISVKLIVGIFLARILMPSDFGLIGMIMVFTNVANELMQGGFTKAFIQKKDANITHSTSAFYFNLTLSIIIYAIIWLCAPVIASFYNEPLLTNITRIISLIVVLDAFCAIKLAILVKRIDFKQKTILVVLSNVISGTISILFAFKGIGVWALVMHILLQKALLAIGLWWKSKFLSPTKFSFTALKEMFSFGIWMLMGTLLIKFFENLNALVIGKLFFATELGFYSKARDYQSSSSKQVTKAFSSVAFPVFSKINHDSKALLSGIRNFLQQVEIAVLPVVTTLFVISYPFVMLILTPKWEPMIIYIKLFCIIGAFFPINAINVQFILANGKSRHNFFLIIIKNVFRLLNVIITYRYGVLYILIGEVIISFFNLYFNTIYAGKRINYGILKQLYDLKFHLMGTILGGLLGYLSIQLFASLTIQLITGLVVTNGVFFGFMYLFNKDVFLIILQHKNKLNHIYYK